MIRKIPKQGRSEFTVSTILEATFQILGVDRPAKNPTAREISERAGVSVGTLYQYFKGTDSIMSRMASDTIQKDMNLLITRFESTEGTLAQRLLILIDELIGENVKAGRVRSFLMRKILNYSIYEFSVREIEKGSAALYRSIEKTHPFRDDLDPEMTIYLLSRSIQAIIMGLVIDPNRLERERPAIVREIAGLIIHFLKNPADADLR